MPELPEVETVRQSLDTLLPGRLIQKVEVFWDRIIKSPAVPVFQDSLQGQRFDHVRRRGKFLLLDMSSYTLISHLRMEGKYYLLSEEEPLGKHAHVVFQLDQGEKLVYDDVRKFGRMELVALGQEEETASIQKLGPEPEPESLKLEDFRNKLKRHKKAIKSLLLDQSAVAGIGNIYADEILFEAGIDPGRPAKSLTNEEVGRVHGAILFIMEAAVESGGTTIRTYKNAFGEDGSYQDQLQVYGKEDQPCPVCGHPIQKDWLAQRGTHYCPVCQK